LTEQSDDSTVSLEQEEKRVRTVLASEYTGFGPLIRQTLNLIQVMLTEDMPIKASELSESKRVTITLLIRIFNELRAVLMLSESGYAFQAFSSAATIYEAGWTIAWIGDDEDKAMKWLNTKESDKILDLKSRVRAGLKRFKNKDKIEEDEVKEYYLYYTELCLAKHMNPAIQQREGFIKDDLGVIFTPGPNDSEAEVRKGLWVMSTAVRFSYPALYIYTQCFLKKEKRDLILRGIKHLEDEHQKCQTWMFERFPK